MLLVGPNLQTGRVCRLGPFSADSARPVFYEFLPYTVQRSADSDRSANYVYEAVSCLQIQSYPATNINLQNKKDSSIRISLWTLQNRFSRELTVNS